MIDSAHDAYRKVKNKYIERIYTDFSMKTPATNEWLEAIISNFILINLTIDEIKEAAGVRDIEAAPDDALVPG